MNNILLLGAGFSYNWGGWLASEVFEYLLGIKEIQDSAYLKSLLWKYKDKGGFEAAIGAVKSDNNKPLELSILNNAVYKMFQDMDKGFINLNSFDFTNSREGGVRSWLPKFDAIFTLNQDILLERYYLNDNVQLLSNREWNGWEMPNLQYNARYFQDPKNSDIPTLSPKITGFDAPFKEKSRIQPYFKLHGSFNWKTGSDNLMVVGGQKEQYINNHKILQWYQDAFKYYLSKANTRLVIVGYSFGDEHINNMLIDAAAHGLTIFIIDPQGVDVLKTHNTTLTGVIKDRTPIEKAIEPILVGASRRKLSAIFAGDINCEYKKVINALLT